MVNRPEHELPRKRGLGVKFPEDEDRTAESVQMVEHYRIVHELDKKVNMSETPFRKDLATEDGSREKCLSKLMDD